MNRLLRFVNLIDSKLRKGQDPVSVRVDVTANMTKLKYDEAFQSQVFAAHEARARRRDSAPPHDTTCQICGRRILAKAGVIAHHGYQRPGDGWQTSSCFGARRRPYEVSSDALPEYISMVTEWAESHEKAVSDMASQPPETLTYHPTAPRRSLAPPPDPVILKRPRGFVPSHPATHSGPMTYEQMWSNIANLHDSKARMARAEIARAERRLKDWTPPR